MKQFQIYLIGVGGQGIGLLSETILRAIDHAGIPVKSVDTHGLAQRGGTVSSHIRMGDNTYSPLIREDSADLVLALEIHEAYRAFLTMLKPGGTLVYYKTSLQPLAVRMGKEKKITPEFLASVSLQKNCPCIGVVNHSLPDSRMENMALLQAVASKKLIPGVTLQNYSQALQDLLAGKTLEETAKFLR
jgi:indolepyruvate ferredoxin oxidoreductase beta subunit